MLRIEIITEYEPARNFAAGELAALLVRDTFGAGCCVYYTPTGAPAIAGAGGPAYISVTHASPRPGPAAPHPPRALAAIALSDTPVGIDAELIRAYPAAVLRRFSPAEREYVKHFGDSGFFEVWTVKEAVLKLRGTGLSGGLSSVRAVYGGAIKNRIGGAGIRLLREGDAVLAVASSGTRILSPKGKNFYTLSIKRMSEI